MIGTANVNTADYSTLIGYNNKAVTGTYSTVVGTNNTLNKTGYVFGQGNTVGANNKGAVILGHSNTVDTNNGSGFLFGSHLTCTSSRGSYYIGQYNKEYISIYAAIANLFAVSIGDQNNPTNALEVKGNGDVYIYGAGGFTGANSDSESVKPIHSVLAALDTKASAVSHVSGEGYSIGTGNSATGENAFATGKDTLAAGDYSRSEGRGRRITLELYGDTAADSYEIKLSGAVPVGMNLFMDCTSEYNEVCNKTLDDLGEVTDCTEITAEMQTDPNSPYYDSHAHQYGPSYYLVTVSNYPQAVTAYDAYDAEIYLYYMTGAYGDYSHIEGDGTVAINDYETVVGQYNNPVEGALFTVGSGYSSSQPENAFLVSSSGNVYINGVGGYEGGDFSSATPINNMINVDTTNHTTILGNAQQIRYGFGYGGATDTTIIGNPTAVSGGYNGLEKVTYIGTGGTLSANNITRVGNGFVTMTEDDQCVIGNLDGNGGTGGQSGKLVLLTGPSGGAFNNGPGIPNDSVIAFNLASALSGGTSTVQVLEYTENNQSKVQYFVKDMGFVGSGTPLYTDHTGSNYNETNLDLKTYIKILLTKDEWESVSADNSGAVTIDSLSPYKHYEISGTHGLSSITISAFGYTRATRMHDYYIAFTTGTTAPTLTLPVSPAIRWKDGDDLTTNI